ncbi:MAG TPA: DMT family transporter [Ignavibacteriaceae bacterium]|nr:DMT family transporter [Ignavibacteriaceae bacterium]
MNWFILAFISAVFSAASAVSEKKALFSIDALNFSFLVSVITLLFSIPFFWLAQYPDIFSYSMLILFIKTLLNAAAFLFVMLSIKNLEISEALPLLALTPGIVAVFGIFLINDYLTLFEWFGIFLMVAGSYILEMKKNTKSLLDPFKSLIDFSKYSFVFIALILFTVTSLLDRVLLKDYNLPPYTFMAFQQLFFALIFAAVVLVKNRNFSASVKTITKNTFYLIVIVSVFTVIYRYTQIEATKAAPVALVLSVKRLSVLMAIIFGGKLFSDANLVRRIIAAIVILIGLTILMYE